MSDAMGALLAVEEIINDLSDRRGLGHEWGSIDDEIQSEIMEGWRVIIDARIAAAVVAEREAWREAAEASISHCRTDCTEESFCGQCEPLLAMLTARGGQ